MKLLSDEFLEALSNESTTLCHCWRLVRLDNVILGFTDHDHSITFMGQNFQAMSGFQASELSEMLGLNIDTQEVSGALSSEQITEEDILAGRFDKARLEVFLVDWKNPEFHLLIKVGTIGEIKRSDKEFHAEIRGISGPLDQTQGRYFSHSCDTDLGTARCGIDISDPLYSATTTITKIENRMVLEVAGLSEYDASWFSYGKLTWLSGENADSAIEIAAHGKRDDTCVLQLWKPMPFPINVGDSISVSAGCNKTFATCKSKFTNAINFQGFPHLPGGDFLMQFAKKGYVYDGSPLIK